jgi:hypothetical protein
MVGYPRILLGYVSISTVVALWQVTDACAKAVYSLLLTILPQEATAGSWAVSKAMLKKVCETRMKTIETCPNDHIAFIDCKHPKLAHYQHYHRTCCPVCGADRILTLPNGKTRAAKTIYHLPIGPWLRDLFRDEEIAPLLAADASTKPPGHVSRSRGWHAKVCGFVCPLSRLS